jgi:hypothetical protein
MMGLDDFNVLQAGMPKRAKEMRYKRSLDNLINPSLIYILDNGNDEFPACQVIYDIYSYKYLK